MHCSSWNRCVVFSKAPVLHGASYGLRLRSRDICSRTSSNLYPASTGSSTYIATRCPKHMYLRHVCSTHSANSTIVFCSNRPHWLDQAAGCSVTFVRPVLPCAPTSRSVPRASPPREASRRLNPSPVPATPPRNHGSRKVCSGHGGQQANKGPKPAGRRSGSLFLPRHVPRSRGRRHCLPDKRAARRRLSHLPALAPSSTSHPATVLHLHLISGRSSLHKPPPSSPPHARRSCSFLCSPPRSRRPQVCAPSSCCERPSPRPVYNPVVFPLLSPPPPHHNIPVLHALTPSFPHAFPAYSLLAVVS